MLEYWRQSVDGPGTTTDQFEQSEMRGVSASRSLNGMLRLDGWMTPIAGEALLAALNTLLPPPDEDDERTPSQRRHDALEDLARDFLDHSNSREVGGERPHISIVCDLPALQGIAGGLHETESGRVITIAELRSLACDASISRIVLGPDSEVIDVGRRTQVAPAALRRAIVVRDGRCTWIDCDRDQTWCDVHHDRHWADFGPTNLDNCRLLCRYHHTLTHLLAETPGQPPLNPRRRIHPRRWGALPITTSGPSPVVRRE